MLDQCDLSIARIRGVDLLNFPRSRSHFDHLYRLNLNNTFVEDRLLTSFTVENDVNLQIEAELDEPQKLRLSVVDSSSRWPHQPPQKFEGGK